MQQQTKNAQALPARPTEMRPVKYHYADTFWCTYIISVISANVAELGELDDNAHFFQKRVEPD